MDSYEPETFVAAVKALFEQRSIEFRPERVARGATAVPVEVLHEDRWGAILDRPEDNTVEIRWFDTTRNMSADDFKGFLGTFAAALESRPGRSALVDATAFALDPKQMVPEWRDANIIPRYNAAGLRKFAFHMPRGMPLIGKEPTKEGPGCFPTAYFGSRREATEWLSGG
jgi:hypothetical protein